jgi:hypothetical protein
MSNDQWLLIITILSACGVLTAARALYEWWNADKHQREANRRAEIIDNVNVEYTQSCVHYMSGDITREHLSKLYSYYRECMRASGVDQRGIDISAMMCMSLAIMMFIQRDEAKSNDS